MEKVTILSQLKFSQAQLDKLQAVSPRLEVHQVTDTPFDDLPETLRDNVEILYTWGGLAEEAHLYPNLKWLQMHSAGIDNLFDAPVWQQDIIISNMSGIHAPQMAEHALAMMLAFRWKLPTMFQLKRNTEWPEGRWDIFAQPELRGSTLGIVGYGAIGRELARQAQALGMHVLAVNRSGQRQPYHGYREPATGDPQAEIPDVIYSSGNLLDMLPACDYVVLLAPLTADTHHLFSTHAFLAMKPTAFFFNLSRGPLVDEAALIDALRQGQIGGAGLDVFEQEPLPPESPLWTLDNVIISPHVAGFSLTYDDRASDLFAENLRRYLAGETLINQVERERGY